MSCKHPCEALIFHCIDFRLGIPINEYLRGKNLLHTCDRVAVAGAAKNIGAAPESEAIKTFLLGQITTSHTLHCIKQVIVMNHTNCGAYPEFDSPEKEKAQHILDLHDAWTAIKTILPPEVEVHLALATILPDGKVSIDPVHVPE
jgi:hypothetical protein